ncbi:MAG: adenosylmethionine--8-amino-7-oxononanoate transaminase, partial [Treponema sp.]
MKNNKSGFFITATNTEVGKTFVTAALLQACLTHSIDAVAVKPIQSGCYQGTAPDVEEYAKVNPQNNFYPKYALTYPASPYYAAQKEHITIDMQAVKAYCDTFLQSHALSLIEGAGGMLVPLTEQDTICDLMQMLDLPAILVCKNELGVLNQILLNLELCKHNGIEVAGIVLNFHDPHDEICSSNVDYLKSVFQGAVICVPKMNSAQEASACFDQFITTYRQEPRGIDHAFDKEHLLHPYTSAVHPLKTYGVTYAKGNYIYTEAGALLDGMSSWWCAYQGYNRKALNDAAITQLNRFSHVMFAGLTHAPAIDLGKKLLSILPKGMEHIFYCDSGSVAVEVALKMALQYQHNKNPLKTKIATIKGGYHGDTFGAMSVCDPVSGMHFLFKDMLAQQIFLPRPSQTYSGPFDESALEEMKRIIEAHKDEIAAIIVEPIVQGAGGMWFYHTEYLRFFRQVCDACDMLLIFDEIATGFGRTGELFAGDLANVVPDIMCMGKAITAGYMSFAAVSANKKTVNGICEHNSAFMHGPTFMANPLACAIAVKNIELLLNTDFKAQVKRIEQCLTAELHKCTEFDAVSDVRVLGAIGVVELTQKVDVQKAQAFFVQQGVWIRPFSNYIYI